MGNYEELYSVIFKITNLRDDLRKVEMELRDIKNNLYVGSKTEKLEYDAQNYPDQMELPLDDE